MTECWDFHSLSLLLTFHDLRTTQRETTQSSGPWSARKYCSPCKSVSSSGGLSGWNRRDRHVPWLRSNRSLSLWCEPSGPGGSGAQYSPLGVPRGLLWLSFPPARANPSHPWSNNCPHPRKDRRAGSTPGAMVPFPGCSTAVLPRVSVTFLCLAARARIFKWRFTPPLCLRPYCTHGVY